MSTVIDALVAACNSKSCAPPPVGSGGSTPGGSFEGEVMSSGSVFETGRRAWSKMTPDEDKARRSYINTGYQKTNQFMRGVSGSNTAAIRAKVEAMRAVFDRCAAPLPGPAVLYRGAVMSHELVSQYKVGAVVKDKAFVSTSCEKSSTSAFHWTVNAERSQEYGLHSVLMRIKAPAGTKVLAGHPDERELILNADTPMRVTAVSVVKGETHVDLEIVQ